MAANLFWSYGRLAIVARWEPIPALKNMEEIVEFLKPLTAQDAVQDISKDIKALLQKICDAGVYHEEIHHHDFVTLCVMASALDGAVKDVVQSLSGAAGRQE